MDICEKVNMQKEPLDAIAKKVRAQKKLPCDTSGRAGALLCVLTVEAVYFTSSKVVYTGTQ